MRTHTKEWNHANAPVLWIETLFMADIFKLKKYFNLNYKGHYFLSLHQLTSFYANKKSEKNATLFGKEKYSDKKFVQNYCTQSKAKEKNLINFLKKISPSNIAKINNNKLADILKKFLDKYSSLMAYYRLSRPEFYQNAVKSLKNIPYLQKTIGKRRIQMRRTWAFAFSKAMPLFKEIGKRIKLTELEVKNCTSEEIYDALQSKKTPKDIKSRLYNFAFIYYKNKFSIKTGINKKSKLLYNKKVQGQTAYPGLTQGRAIKIFSSAQNIKHMGLKNYKGKILITGMTTPDMLPILKQVKAFVTDAGGILCHAAIFSREMKKPCVIGTKIATKVFKDGDLVEVNANTGVVRKLK